MPDQFMFQMLGGDRRVLDIRRDPMDVAARDVDIIDQVGLDHPEIIFFVSLRDKALIPEEQVRLLP